jgi:hypothetical protein
MSTHHFAFAAPAARLALGAALLLAAAAPAGAQDVALFATGGTSDHQDLRRPLGYGAYASVPLLSFLAVRVGFDQQTSTVSREHTVCDSYWPHFAGCEAETLQRRTRLGTWGAAAMLHAQVAPGVRLEVGGGPTRTTLQTTHTTESGRNPGDVMPMDTQRGFAWIGGATLRRPFGLSVTPVAEVVRHRYDFDGCYTDVGTPFCGRTTVTELRLGVRRGL